MPLRGSLRITALLSSLMAANLGGGQAELWQRLPLPGGNARKVLFSHSTPPVLYAASDNGVFRSLDSGDTWRASHGSLPPRIIQDLAIDPNSPGVIYASSEEDGLWKSINRGMTWFKLDNGLPSLPFLSLAVHPGEGRILLLGTHGGGIFRSLDGGASWIAANQGLTFDRSILALAFAPSDPRIVYAISRSFGPYRSRDGGASWTRINSGFIELPRGPLAVSPWDPNLVLAAGGTGLYRTIDGENWGSADGASLVSQLVFDPSQNGVVYAASAFGLRRSQDAGAAFETIDPGDADSPFQSWSIAVDPGNPQRLALSNEQGILLSDDRAESWRDAGQGLFLASVGAVAVDPANPLTLYAGSEGGTFKSVDGGLRWHPIRLDFRPLAVQDLVIDARRPSRILLLHRSGAQRSLDGAITWAPLGFMFDRLKRQLLQDPNDPEVLYAATSPFSGVIKSSDGGASWTPARVGIEGGTVYALASSLTQSQRIYAAAVEAVYVTTDAAGNWEPTASQPPGGPRSLLSDPFDPLQLWVGTEEGDVLHTSDGGESWEDLSAGLPAVSIRALARDPDLPGRLYAATWGMGIYQKDSTQSPWTPINDGLDNRFVRTLAFEGGVAKRLLAGGLGGLYKLDLHPSQPAPILVTNRVSGNRFPGGDVVYEIRIENLSQEPQSLELVDALAPGLSLVSVTADRGEAFQGPSTNSITWRGDLDPSEAATILLRARISLGTRSQIVTNQGLVRTAGGRLALSVDPDSATPFSPTLFQIGEEILASDLAVVPTSLGLPDTFVSMAVARISGPEFLLPVQGYDESGNLIEEATFPDPVPSSGQVAFLTREALPGSSQAATLAVPQGNGVESFFMMGDLAGQRLDGIGQKLLEAEVLFLPEARRDHESETLLYLFNDDRTESNLIQATLHSAQGATVSEGELELAPLGSQILSLGMFFGSEIAIHDGYIRLQGSRPLRAFEVVSKGDSFSTLAGAQGVQSDELWAPHFFVDLLGGTTQLKILNTGNQTLVARLDVIRDHLPPIELDFEVDSGQVRVVDLADLVQPPAQGHIRLELEAGFLAFPTLPSAIAFVNYEGASSLTRSSLPLEVPGQTATFLQVAHDAGLGIFQGLAILNPSADPRFFRLRVFDRQGRLRTRFNFIPSRGRLVGLLDDIELLGPGFAQIGGVLMIDQSNGPLVAYSIFGSASFFAAIQGR